LQPKRCHQPTHHARPKTLPSQIRMHLSYISRPLVITDVVPPFVFGGVVPRRPSAAPSASTPHARASVPAKISPVSWPLAVWCFFFSLVCRVGAPERAGHGKRFRDDEQVCTCWFTACRNKHLCAHASSWPPSTPEPLTINAPRDSPVSFALHSPLSSSCLPSTSTTGVDSLVQQLAATRVEPFLSRMPPHLIKQRTHTTAHNCCSLRRLPLGPFSPSTHASRSLRRRVARDDWRRQRERSQNATSRSPS
jgi:hypothetical protein